MVSSKAPIAAAVALLAQLCRARDHLVFRNVSDSPPRTVTGEHGCYTDFDRDYRGSVPTFSRLYSYTFPVTAYSYFIPSTSTITVTPTVSGGGGGGGGGGSVTGPITSTSTVTTTTHVTSFGTATTITAGPRFTPLASALNHRRPASGRPQVQDSGYRANDDSLVLGVDKAGLAKADPPLFPQAVVCEMVIRVFTTSTSTITASYAATTTITLPAPNATTTTIAPVQNATTATTTTTVTSTITDEMANPTQTVYQACQANNLVSGHGAPQTYFVEAIHSWHVVREQRIAETAENCCIACQGEADCGGSLYHMFSGICYTFRTGGEGHGHGGNPGGHGGQCRAPGELRSTANVADGAVFVASNGQCGGWWVSDEAPI
ncbi:hypothetical protein CaCOL14_004281 [Colletotrichum acutatum]